MSNQSLNYVQYFIASKHIVVSQMQSLILLRTEIVKQVRKTPKFQKRSGEFVVPAVPVT